MGHTSKAHIFVHYVGGDLFMILPITNLRLKIGLLGVVCEGCQRFSQNLHSKSLKMTCKSRAFKTSLETWGQSHF